MSISKIIIVVLIIVAAVILFGGKGTNGFGRLPGDQRIDFAHGRVYVPITTCILLSVLASIVLNLFLRFWR